MEVTPNLALNLAPFALWTLRDKAAQRRLALTPKQLKSMVPIQALRGRPKSEHKKLLVSVRYSQEVVEFFKSTGEGWQSRMDGVLRQYVARHSRSA